MCVGVSQVICFLFGEGGARVVYLAVSPDHICKSGDVMPPSRRLRNKTQPDTVLSVDQSPVNPCVTMGFLARSERGRVHVRYATTVGACLTTHMRGNCIGLQGHVMQLPLDKAWAGELRLTFDWYTGGCVCSSISFLHPPSAWQTAYVRCQICRPFSELPLIPPSSPDISRGRR